jgi:hypothetical protein
MRTASLVLQLALILFVRSTIAADDDPRNIAGYGKTVWGMTEDEVLAAEAPRAERVEKPEPAETGDIASIVIKGLEIAGTQFTTTFLFDSQNRKLKHVSVSSANDVGGGVGIIFSNIERLFTEKYGQPIFNRKGENVVWKLQKTTIELAAFNIPPVYLRNVTIVYRPTQASADASKNL